MRACTHFGMSYYVNISQQNNGGSGDRAGGLSPFLHISLSSCSSCFVSEGAALPSAPNTRFALC